MNNLFRLTSFRLIIIYTLLFTLSIGFVAFYLYWSTSRDFQIKVDDEIIKESIRLDQVYKRYKEVGLIRVIQDLSKTPNPNLYILRDSNNKFIAGNFSDTDSLWNLKRLDNRVVLFIAEILFKKFLLKTYPPRRPNKRISKEVLIICLLYTSDAADE